RLPGGAPRGQWIHQDADTHQGADSDAHADQNAENSGGPFGDATQDVTNSADSSASNAATTDQTAEQSQSNSNGCYFLCGGDAQGQWIDQDAETHQHGDSAAHADQAAGQAGGGGG